MGMPRQARLDAPGTLHQVMGRGMEGSRIFRNDSDREDFLSLLGEPCKVAALNEMLHLNQRPAFLYKG